MYKHIFHALYGQKGKITGLKYSSKKTYLNLKQHFLLTFSLIFTLKLLYNSLDRKTRMPAPNRSFNMT